MTCKCIRMYCFSMNDNMNDNMTDSVTGEQLPCLNLNHRKATRVLNRIYDEHLSRAGVNVGQFSILRAVSTLGETTNKELQSLLAMDQTTLTRNLKPLMRDGLLLATPGEDRRQRILTLSEHGRAVYHDAKVYWYQAQQKIYQHLGPERCQQLLELSQAIVNLNK
ncbi:MAG: MarR family winged helix-turn-helix transcriptional regulator [Photobacterium frigidiphilum]|uniref:MarR family winged helix-turn-helix transcriptional regulator n=1 Tax=Photobacterium frigidiphilum TaxID=264736 RepID=UPI003003446B